MKNFFKNIIYPNYKAIEAILFVSGVSVAYPFLVSTIAKNHVEVYKQRHLDQYSAAEKDPRLMREYIKHCQRNLEMQLRDF